MTASAAIVSTTPKKLYLWHHQLHTEVAKEQLAFVLVQYEPTYKRSQALLQIKQALQKLNVRSYAIWELIGDYDVIVQAWLPVATTSLALQQELEESAARGYSVDVLVMRVEQFLCHWMWRDEPLDVSAALGEIDPKLLHELNGGSSTISSRLLSQFQAKNYLYPIGANKTIKFFLRISPQRRAIRTYGKEEMAERMRAAVAECTEVISACLMRVQADGVAYLLTGRVRAKDFEAVALKLQPLLAEKGMFEAIGSRTTTHLSALYGPLDRREQLLPVPEDPGRLNIPATELLERYEGSDLEFKATAFTDLRKSIDAGKVQRSTEATWAVAKAVVGLLNAFGGTVVVGVAESKHFSIEETVGVGYSEAVQVNANCLALGVQQEFRNLDNWDDFERRLSDKIRSLIKPATSHEFRIRPEVVGGCTLAVIDVAWPTRFFFLRTKIPRGPGQVEEHEVFFGRFGSQTRPLEGTAMLDYQDQHPRAASVLRE